MKSVVSYCFYNLFYNCENISDCSNMTLPATTLAINCYNGMFYDCTSLTEAPAIKTYTPELYAFDNMLSMFTWGLLTSCNWPDLTLSDAESMVLNEPIFGYDDPGASVRISITCKDRSGTAYYDSAN